MLSICYVKLADAFKLQPGMKAYIYPSTVDKQEYGHIEGVVDTISSHVASEEDLKMQIASDEVIRDIEKEGSVVEVRCRLERDPMTASGYTWSTKKGKDIKNGAVYMAYKGKVKIVPVGIAGSFKPFTRVYVNYGEPIDVAKFKTDDPNWLDVATDEVMKQVVKLSDVTYYKNYKKAQRG